MKVTISIIVPVFNGARFIQRAYDGIIREALEDFEIIFVDNNSTDASMKILTAIAKKDSRVVCTSEKKQGAAAARNKGARLAKGDFLYFFDVDDTLVRHALTQLRQTLIQHPEVAGVFGKMVKGEYTDIVRGVVTPIIKQPPTYGLQWFANVSTLPGTPSFLHRKMIFNQIGGFPETLKVGEDAAFHIQYGIEYSLAFLDIPVFVYNRHSESTTSLSNQKQHKVFQYWPRIIRVHLPYFLRNETPTRFKSILYREVYVSLGKMTVLSNGMSNRIKLRAELLQQIKEMEVPKFVLFWTTILALTGSMALYKFYAHYLIKPYLNRKYELKN